MVEIGDGLLQEGVGALLDARDPDQAGLAEQRRRRQRQQGAGRVVVGADVTDLEGRIFGAQIVAHAGDRTLGADLFRAEDEDHGCRAGIAP
ncbi:hypothetical protein D3C73_1422450 [compost metagenome]